MFSRRKSPASIKRLDLDYGIALGSSDYLQGGEDVFKWIGKKMQEAERIVNSTNQILGVAFQDAMAPLGTPANPEKPVYTAKKLAHAYENAIEWAIECSRVGVANEEFEKILRLTGQFLNNMIGDIEEFSTMILRETDKLTPHKLNPSEEPKVIKFTLKLTVKDSPEFYAELKRIKELYGIYD